MFDPPTSDEPGEDSKRIDFRSAEESEIKGGVWLKALVGAVVCFLVAVVGMIRASRTVVTDDATLLLSTIAYVLVAAITLGAILGGLLGVRDLATRRLQKGLHVSLAVRWLFVDGWLFGLLILIVVVGILSVVLANS